MKPTFETFVFLILTSFLFLACDEDVVKSDSKTYDGPLMVLTNIETLYSDSAVLKVKLNAKEQWEYANGDRLFPKGIQLVFHQNGEATSTLVADKGRYIKSTDTYNVTGNVVIQGLKENKKMTSEELNWNPLTKKVTTNKFVTIETAKEKLWGTGLVATQDFKQYKITNPKGFSIKKVM